jgi:protease-4
MSENNPQVDAPMSSDVSTSVGWERATIEKLLLVQLREQTAARRWKVFFRLAWLALVAAAVWLYASGVPHSPGPSVSHTAMVQIRGAIDGASEASAENMVSSLRSAFEEPTAQAIVLLIDSPGGSPVQAGIVHDEIVRLKALHNKKGCGRDLCQQGQFGGQHRCADGRLWVYRADGQVGCRATPHDGGLEQGLA